MTMTRINWVHLIALLAAMLAIVMLAGGCFIPNPGYQTAMGLGQTKTYIWNEQGGIEVKGKGPQEESFVMAEGIIILNEDGTIDIEKSHLTHYLKSEPSANEAAQTMAAILLTNVEQSRQLNEFANKLLVAVKALLPQSDVEPG